MTSPDIFMQQAIDLSREAARGTDGGPFAAIIVKNEVVIATGHNSVLRDNDPTAHAEIITIRNACRLLKTFSLRGCELYSSCEPCPMCLGAAYWSYVDRIYYGNTREDAAAIGFQDQLLYEELLKRPAARRTPMHQLLHSQAQVAFNEWRARTDKRAY